MCEASLKDVDLILITLVEILAIIAQQYQCNACNACNIIFFQQRLNEIYLNAEVVGFQYKSTTTINTLIGLYC